MGRFRHVTSGVFVNVDDATAEALGSDLEPADSGSGSTDEGYSAMKVEQLKAEIDSRNEGRDEADLLSTEGKKADLIATLEADDNK